MNPDDPLLRILACPLDKGPLHLLVPDGPAADEALYNPRLHRRYPIVDGIPQLLPSSGEQVSDDEHEELLLRLTGGNPQTPGMAQ
ncbi:Trm112 family protein [Streptomyces sp. NPDC047043]|uniref:Trm112 family protein n=1 Tax=Streptomyces sp. NPDC047043 TaxID=3154497 RepID=UPI0033F959C8